MNVTRLLLNLRDRLDESVANVWTDLELLRYAQGAVRYMMRRQVDVDPSYHNLELSLPRSGAIAIAGTDFYTYELPWWTYRVTTARESGGSFIPFRTLYQRTGRFWTYDRFNRVRLSGTGAIDLVLEVTKEPAPLFKGTVSSSPAPTSTSIHLNLTTILVGGEAPEILRGQNDYANSVLEFTGVDTTAHLIAGTRRRVVSSSIVTSGGAFFLKLDFEKPLTVTPATGDTVELVPEVHPAHSEFLILLACKKAYLKKANLQALSAMADDLAREEARFIDSITPRQDQEQAFVNMSTDAAARYDYDIDYGGLP